LLIVSYISGICIFKQWFIKNIGRALINLGGCLIGSFDVSETNNDIFYIAHRHKVRRPCVEREIAQIIS